MERDREAGKINAMDSAIATASPRLEEILNILGQDVERGYRSTLSCLWDAEPGTWFGPEWRVEKAIRLLNIVVFACGHDRRLNDDKLADLVSFFIQRMRYM